MQYNVQYMPMPLTVGGFVVDRGDGAFTIVINKDQDAPTQQHTLTHELAHIRLDHFHDSRCIAAIEKEADAEANT